MQNKNSQRGQTQLVLKNNPVNIPELVSGSSTQAVTQQSSQRQALKMPKQVRQYSYLTRACGFTLIELLVVVLIIGILAAVALPQYQKAVAKSRATELAIAIKNFQHAIDLYVLEHGYQEVSFPNGDGLSLAQATNIAKGNCDLACFEDEGYQGCYIHCDTKHIFLDFDKNRTTGQWGTGNCGVVGLCANQCNGVDSLGVIQCNYIHQALGMECIDYAKGSSCN